MKTPMLVLSSLLLLSLSPASLAQMAPPPASPTAPPLPAAAPAAAPVTPPATPAPAAPAQTAPVQAPGTAPWGQTDLQAATYVLLAPGIDGDVKRLNPDEQKMVIGIMQQGLQAAVQKKYPAARFVSDPATPGVIALHPVLTVPQNLSFSSQFQARVELSQGGQNAVVQDTFSVLELYFHQKSAGDFVFGRLANKLP
jgi:hypothetical protein